MRASPPIALALLAFAPCFGATVEEIAERSMPSVVKIVKYDDTGEEMAQGSGFFISPQRIITNEHVIDGAYSAEIFTDEGYYDRITILNVDKDMDLAILRVDAQDEIPLQINPDAELKPGQPVIAIGHPLGLLKTLSDGLISAVRTTDQLQILQITAPISLGSSGGPLLDEEGRVIGVVFATIREGQNLNFAIGVETVNEFLALEETPRQLEVAGAHVLRPVVVDQIEIEKWVEFVKWRRVEKWIRVAKWLAVAKWIVTDIGVLIAIAFGGWWVIAIGIVAMLLLWLVLSWLRKSIYRRLTPPFRQRRHCTALVTRQPSLIVGLVLLIGTSWFLFPRVTSPASPTQSTVAQIESAPTTDTQNVTVYITRTGSKYHRSNCRYLRKSKIPITLKDAKQHYGPCSVCKPPK